LFKRPTAVLLAGILVLLAQPIGHAQAPPLQFFKNYFLPGAGHVVAGIGLRGQGQNGFATGNVVISGVPSDADIAAVFYYWMTLEPNGDTPLAEGALFRGQQVSGKDIGPGVRVPACWGSGGGGATSSTTQARVYRADILKNFPEDATTGKLLVNGTHQLSVPDTGGGGTQSPSSGNQVTYAEGAAVVVVFSVTSDPTLKSVVIYDGASSLDADHVTFNLNVGGYYDATDTPNAKITTLVGDGRNRPETLTINGTPISDPNPFRGTLGSAWDNPTFNVTGTVSDTGIPVALTFPSPSVDCLIWAGVVAELNIQDTDGDGIPNAVEDAATPLVQPPSREFPAGLALPDYKAMGASSSIPDVFVEFGFFTTTGWGGSSNVGAHDHRPDPGAVEMVAKAFKRQGINSHFDVGAGNGYPAGVNPITTSSCGPLSTWTLACAIVPNAHARGGEFITERACGLDPNAPCQFTSQMGVVGWKSGYNYYRDAWEQTNGVEFTPEQENQCEQSGACQRRRFDENRRDGFHYVLWAHALGLPKDPNQCLAPSVFDPVDNRCENAGTPVPDNPLYHVTGTHSGFGDKWGGDVLITLHGFGGANFNGAEVSQAGTLLHELAHNFGRGHAGDDTTPNCKSNYVSSANYLFQVHGIPMLDSQGQAVLGVDLSGQVLGFGSNADPLDETDLADGPFVVQGGGSPAYATRWYAPAATSFINSGLQITPATKHCNGSAKLSTDPPMVRIEGASATGAIDWLNNGNVTDTNLLPQDINFSGGPVVPTDENLPSDGPFTGSNDWEYVKDHGLKQVGNRPNMGLLSIDVLTSDLGRGDPGRGDPGRGDPGRGDPGRGDPGRGDPGRGDPGRGDPGSGEPGAPGGDLDIDTATGAHAQAPHQFRAAKMQKTVRLTWSPSFVRPQGVAVQSSTVFRVEGTAITPVNFAKRKFIGQVFGTTTSLVDDKPLNNKPVVYILYEDWNDNPSTRSGFVTVGFTYTQ
jgi:hypothetical protein